MKNQYVKKNAPGSTPGASTTQPEQNQIVNCSTLVPNPSRTVYGSVYVMSNPNMDCVKIGFTTQNPRNRAKRLKIVEKSQGEFTVEYEAFFQNPRSIEKIIHDRFKTRRLSREFYKVSAEEVKNFIEAELYPLNKIEYLRKLME